MSLYRHCFYSPFWWPVQPAASTQSYWWCYRFLSGRYSTNHHGLSPVYQYGGLGRRGRLFQSGFRFGWRYCHRRFRNYACGY